MSHLFKVIYDILATENNGKEPLMNILAWYGLEKIKTSIVTIKKKCMT